MSEEQDYIRRNSEELVRLRELVHTMSEEELATDAGGGWTISAMLAHCAFWDRYAFLQWETWEREGFKPLPVDVESLNAACFPVWLLVPPRAAADEAIVAAEAIDSKVEGLNPTFVKEFLAQGYGLWRLHTYEHRGEHLDEIEQALGRSR